MDPSRAYLRILRKGVPMQGVVSELHGLTASIGGPFAPRSVDTRATRACACVLDLPLAAATISG